MFKMLLTAINGVDLAVTPVDQSSQVVQDAKTYSSYCSDSNQ
jgi:hypothetical protein